MFYVHGWHIVVLLYPQRVGFGIAYSVTKGNARASISGISKVADSRASFYISYKQDTSLLWRFGNHRHQEVAPDTYIGL